MYRRGSRVVARGRMPGDHEAIELGFLIVEKVQERTCLLYTEIDTDDGKDFEVWGIEIPPEQVQYYEQVDLWQLWRDSF